MEGVRSRTAEAERASVCSFSSPSQHQVHRFPALPSGVLPTDDVPRKADGTPDLTAPAPRLPDGKPDLSGIRHAVAINQCVPETGQFRSLEIGSHSGLAAGLASRFA